MINVSPPIPQGGDYHVVRSATYVIAGSDAPAHVKAQADRVCTGTADDVVIQAALDLYKVVELTEGTFAMSAGSGSTPILKITNDGTILRGRGESTVLDFSAMASTIGIRVGVDSPVGTPTLLTANVSNVNNKTLPVTDGSGFAPDDVAELYSDDVFIDAAVGKLGELVEVASVAGNTVTTKAPIFGTPYNSTTAYTTANNAALVKITPVKGVRLENFKIVGNRSKSGGKGIVASYAVDTTIDGVFVQDTIYSGISADHSLRGTVTNCRFDGINEAGYGYGFVMYYTTRDWKVTDCKFTDGRHSTDLGGSVAVPGVPRNLTVTGCLSENMIAATYSSHVLGDYVTYIGNTAAGFADYGVALTCLHGTIQGNTITRPTANTCVGVAVLGTDHHSIQGGVTVEGNTLNGNGLYSVYADMVDNVRIAGNACEMGRSTYGRIEVQLSSHVTVVGNTTTGLNGSSSPFIRVVDSSHVVITGNTGKGVLATTDQHGIYVLSSTVAMSHIVIEGNEVYNYARNHYGGITIEEGGGFAISNVLISNNVVASASILAYGLLVTKTGSDYTITHNNLADNTHDPVASLTGMTSSDIVKDNQGYVASGEIRTASGSLTAGSAGDAVMAWQNPEAQGMIVTARTNITTGGVATSTGDMGLATTVQVVEDCEDVWAIHANATDEVTCAVDTTYVERGTNCLKFTILATVDTNDIMATEVVSDMDISTATHIQFKAMVTTTSVAGDFQLLLDEDADCASPSYALNFPALTANQMTLVVLAINGGAAAGATVDHLISVGLKYTKAVPAANTLYIDDIRAITVGSGLFNDLALDATGIGNATTPLYVGPKATTAGTDDLDTIVMTSATAATTGIVGNWYITGQAV